MIQRVSIAVLLAVGGSATAAPRVEAAPAPRQVSVSTLQERGGWSLFVGIAIFGLVLRRRRTGNVVAS